MGSPHAASGWPWMDTLGLREAWIAQRNGGPDLSSRGGTHASHGLDREGQPRTVSKRSLRKWMLGMPFGLNVTRAARGHHRFRQRLGIPTDSLHLPREIARVIS